MVDGISKNSFYLVIKKWLKHWLLHKFIPHQRKNISYFDKKTGKKEGIASVQVPTVVAKEKPL